MWRRWGAAVGQPQRAQRALRGHNCDVQPCHERGRRRRRARQRRQQLGRCGSARVSTWRVDQRNTTTSRGTAGRTAPPTARKRRKTEERGEQGQSQGRQGHVGRVAVEREACADQQGGGQAPSTQAGSKGAWQQLLRDRDHSAGRQGLERLLRLAFLLVPRLLNHVAPTSFRPPHGQSSSRAHQR